MKTGTLQLLLLLSTLLATWTTTTTTTTTTAPTEATVSDPLLSYLAAHLKTDLADCDQRTFVGWLIGCWREEEASDPATTPAVLRSRALARVALRFHSFCSLQLPASCSIPPSPGSSRQLLDGIGNALERTDCNRYFVANSVLDEFGDERDVRSEDRAVSEKQWQTMGAGIADRLLRGECLASDSGTMETRQRQTQRDPLDNPNLYLNDIFDRYFDNVTMEIQPDGIDRLLVDVHLDPPQSDDSDPSNDNSTGVVIVSERRQRRSEGAASNRLDSVAEPSLSRLLRGMLSLMPEQRSRRSVDDSTTVDDSSNKIEKCQNGAELLAIFDGDNSGGLNETELLQMCAYVVYQISHGRKCEAEYNPAEPFDAAKVYGYGTLCVFVISACSALGFLIIPTLSASIYDILMTSFIALAFGTLTGDALLHLFPQSILGDAANAGYNGVMAPDSFYKSLVIMMSIYLLYVFEGLTGLLVGHNHAAQPGAPGGDQHGHSHTHSHDFIREQTDKAKAKDLAHQLEIGDADAKEQLQAEERKGSWSVSQADSQHTMVHSSETSGEENVIMPIILNEEQLPVCLGLTSLALVIIVGDAIHNVTDGISIGASFAHDIKGGLSTALAVFFHELPHEFGDFVILLTTGLSLRQALFWNFISSLTSFIGLYVGIAVGENENAIDWIFAMTSGMFLYVAIADMLPEMRNIKSHRPYIAFLAQNIGALIGMGFMVFMYFLEDLMKF